MSQRKRGKKDKSNESKSPMANAEQKETTVSVSSVVVDPMEEIFSYVGNDSTAIIDIAILDEGVENNDELALARRWRTEVAEGDSEREPDPEEILNQGVEIAKALSAEANRLMNLAQKSHGERAIMLGQVCIVLKETVKRLPTRTLWEPWADEHLSFIAERNREKFMRLAKRQDCYKWDFLGVERLDMLVSATEDMKKEKDPIGRLLGKCEIEFDEKSEMELGTFKRKIDAAMAAERLERENLVVDFKLVQDVINANGKIDRPLINRLKDVKGCEGKPKKLLEDLILSGGKKHGSRPEDRPLDFNKLSADLIKTIDYLIDEPDYIDALDSEIFEKLVVSLKKLKKLYAAGNVIKKAA